MSNRAAALHAPDTEPLVQLVESCAFLLSAAAGAESKARAGEWAAQASKALETALENPEVKAAFAEVFLHPELISARIGTLKIAELEQASDEVFGVAHALKDHYRAKEIADVRGLMTRLQGPRPWDTFFSVPSRPDEALMPLYGARSPEVLGFGRALDGDPQKSPGGQALFYPIGGYERFADAQTIVVTQNLEDGLAIDDQFRNDPSTAVVVASAPEAVMDVCADMERVLVGREAVARERQELSLAVALSQTRRPSEAVDELLAAEPRVGVSIMRSTAAPDDATAKWATARPDVIMDAVICAEIESRDKIDKATDARVAQLEEHGRFAEKIRELRESVQVVKDDRAVDGPKVDKARSRSAGVEL